MASNNILKILGRKIRAVRKGRKISQESLAELSGFHPTYISDIERGKVNASITTFYQIVKALDIPLEELVKIPMREKEMELMEEIMALLGHISRLDKKKQVIFLAAAKGLIAGIEKI
jgi:transcriptional regulator with XRE-family HTH domain